MSLFIFASLILSIVFLAVMGTWYDVNGPFISHMVMLISATVAILSGTIVIAAQSLHFSKSSKKQSSSDPRIAAWGKEVSATLSTPAVVLDGYKISFANTSFLQTLGMTGMADQVVGMPFTNLVHPTDHQILAEMIAEATQGKNINEIKKLRLLCSDGTTVPSHTSLTRIRQDDNNNQVLFQFTPVSTAKPLSTNFESQFNYHLIIDRLEEIVFQINAEGQIIFLNSAWEHMLDYKIQECLNKPLINYIHPEDKPAVESRLTSLTQGKRTHCLIEFRLIARNGNSQWSELRGKTTSASENERTSVIGTITDISRTKEAQANVNAHRRSLSTLLNNIPGMVYRGRNDRFWTFEFVSDGCADVTGYDPMELINNPAFSFNQIIHPEDRTAVWESVQQQIHQHEKFQLIYRIIARNGEIKHVLEHGRGIFSSAGELLALEGFIVEIPNESLPRTTTLPNLLSS